MPGLVYTLLEGHNNTAVLNLKIALLDFLLSFTFKVTKIRCCITDIHVC